MSLQEEDWSPLVQKKRKQEQKVSMNITVEVSTLVVMLIFDEASHYQGMLKVCPPCPNILTSVP